MKRFLGFFLCIGLAFAAPPRLVSYRAEIHSNAGNGLAVKIKIRTVGDPWQQPAFTIESGFSDIKLSSDDGNEESSPRLERAGVLDRLTIARPCREVTIHYVVSVEQSGSSRIPLPVPEIPTTGAAGAVAIVVSPGPGQIVTGDTFPALEKQAAGAFVAELSNVPNHLQLTFLPTGQASLRDRWVTPARISDLAVILLLAAGAITRAAMGRKGGE